MKGERGEARSGGERGQHIGDQAGAARDARAAFLNMRQAGADGEVGVGDTD